MNQTPSGMPDIAGELFVVGDLHVDVGQQRVTRAGVAVRSEAAPAERCPHPAACNMEATPSGTRARPMVPSNRPLPEQ